MITREFPNAVNPFLRFQVGETFRRPSRIPQYGIDNKFYGHVNGPWVEMFRLFGWGDTLAKAEKMAKRNASRGTILL